jgi:hypothetical protein
MLPRLQPATHRDSLLFCLLLAKDCVGGGERFWLANGLGWLYQSCHEFFFAGLKFVFAVSVLSLLVV